MSPSPPPLADHLCFALYGASMAVGRLYKPLLDGLGITYPQYLVLTALAQEDRRTVGALADRLLLDPSTVTPLVKRLASGGHVRRERNPADERQVIVELTEAGRETLGRATCLAERLLSGSGYSLEHIRELNEEVRRFRDAVAAGT